MPEVDVMMPDPGFIAERRDRLLGLVITHAHEDHIGAVAHGCGRSCAARSTRRRSPPPCCAASWREAQLLNQVKLHVDRRPAARSSCAPFGLRFLRVAHSIPEAQALAISTPHGVVLHTGDWKLDPDPLIGPPTDEAAFAALGDDGRAGDGLRFHQRDGRRPFRARRPRCGAACRR